MPFLDVVGGVEFERRRRAHIKSQKAKAGPAGKPKTRLETKSKKQLTAAQKEKVFKAEQAKLPKRKIVAEQGAEGKFSFKYED